MYVSTRCSLERERDLYFARIVLRGAGAVSGCALSASEGVPLQGRH